jgi:hypothetical protein
MNAVLAFGIALAMWAPASPAGLLKGHVEIGPIKPVERPGKKEKVPPALYRPYTILVSHGAFKKELKLSDTGEFATKLAPGSYTVSVKAKVRLMNPPEARKVVIAAGKATVINFSIDTGIR